MAPSARIGPASPRPGHAHDHRSLEAVAEQVRPHLLARDDLVPVHEAFSRVLGAPGLRRGTTVVIGSGMFAGASALALGLLADATTAGMWCAVVDLPTLGLVAAAEFGVALDRLVLIPSARARPIRVLAALLDGCDIVVARQPTRPSAGEARRLMARARERRSILVVCTPAPPDAGWPEAPDIAIEVVGSQFTGIGAGSGRLTGHRVEVLVTRRRAFPAAARHAALWLPGPDGRIDVEIDRGVEGRSTAVGER